MKLLMKVTSRARPEQLIRTVQRSLACATNTDDMAWLFTFDQLDQQYDSAPFLRALRACFHSHQEPRIVFGHSDSKIEAVNRDVPSTDWDVLVNISDDQRPIVIGYDQAIRSFMPPDLDASLWFRGELPLINTQEIVGRRYYERFGYTYHPAFRSFYADNLSTAVAMLLGKCVYSAVQIVEHDNITAPLDALYVRNAEAWEADQKTHERLTASVVRGLVR